MPTYAASSSGGSSSGGGSSLPYTATVNYLVKPVTHINWDSNHPQDSMQYLGGYTRSSGAQNDEIAWDLLLAAGTYTIRVVYTKDANRGIASVRLDGTEVGTVDAYASATQRNVFTDITAVSVASGGIVRVKLVVATKNASSSGYFFDLTQLAFTRTGA